MSFFCYKLGSHHHLSCSMDDSTKKKVGFKYFRCIRAISKYIYIFSFINKILCIFYLIMAPRWWHLLILIDAHGFVWGWHRGPWQGRSTTWRSIPTLATTSRARMIPKTFDLYSIWFWIIKVIIIIIFFVENWIDHHFLNSLQNLFWITFFSQKGNGLQFKLELI